MVWRLGRGGLLAPTRKASWWPAWRRVRVEF